MLQVSVHNNAGIFSLRSKVRFVQGGWKYGLVCREMQKNAAEARSEHLLADQPEELPRMQNNVRKERISCKLTRALNIFRGKNSRTRIVRRTSAQVNPDFLQSCIILLAGEARAAKAKKKAADFREPYTFLPGLDRKMGSFSRDYCITDLKT